MDVLEALSWAGVVRIVSRLLVFVRLDRGSVRGVMGLGVLGIQEILEIREIKKEILGILEIKEIREIKEEVEFVIWESVGVQGSLSRIGAEITVF